MTGRRASIMIVTLGLAAAAAWPGRVATAREDVIRALDERTQTIRDVSGTYRSDKSASVTYVAAYAQALKIPEAQVRERHELDARLRFAARLAGDRLHERLLETETFRKDGSPASHRIFAFDGETHVFVRDIPRAEDRFVASVTLGRDMTKVFDQTCDPAILLGLALPTGEGTLARNAESHHATVEEVVDDDGSPCAQLTFTQPGHAGRRDGCRYVVRLDRGRGLALRSLTWGVEVEDEPSGYRPWHRWTTRQFARDPATGLWYPARAEETELGDDGLELVTRSIAIEPLRFNKGLTSSAFRPAVEDGSNVYDSQKKRGFVAGGKPSPRILRFIKQTAEESRLIRQEAEEPRRAIRGEDHAPARIVPPTGGSRAGRYLILGGLTAIVAAIVWQWRMARAQS